MYRALVKLAAVLLGVAVFAGVEHERGARMSHTAAPTLAQPAEFLDATTDTEARLMRRATRHLAEDLSAAARCDIRRSPGCVLPALHRAGMGGRTTAMLVRGVMARVPAGRCRTYLFGLAAANDAAGDQARWLLMQFYGGPERRRAVAAQIGLAARMLHRAWPAAGAGVCAPGADGPAT
jgi:hypothetical protein